MSKAGTSTQVRQFSDVPEDWWVVRPVRDIKGDPVIYGTSALLTCIGLYMRITEHHFFMAHINNNIWRHKSWETYLAQSDSDRPDEQLCTIFATNLSKMIREGLNEQGVKTSDEWNQRDPKKYIAESLTVCYVEKHIDKKRRPSIALFRKALSTWADVPPAPDMSSAPQMWLPPGNVSMYGFVVTDPTDSSIRPMWLKAVSALSDEGNPRDYQDDKEGKTWVGSAAVDDPRSELEIDNGVGHKYEMRMTTLFGDIGQVVEPSKGS